MYKTAIGIAFVIAAITACSSIKVSRTLLQKDFAFVAEVYKTSREDGKLLLTAKTALTNNTNDTVRFLSMSCSYFEEYSTNSKNIRLYSEDCFKNISELKEIAPYKTFERVVTLHCNMPIEEVMKSTYVSVSTSQGLVN